MGNLTPLENWNNIPCKVHDRICYPHHINHIKQTTPKQEECIEDGNANIDISKWQTN